MFTIEETKQLTPEENRESWINCLKFLGQAHGAMIVLQLAAVNGDFEAFHWYMQT